MTLINKVPRFKGKIVLFLLSSVHVGKIYKISNSKMKIINKFSVDKKYYSDREGFFMTRAGNVSGPSGAVYEDSTKEKRKKYYRKLERNLNNIKHTNIDELIISVPDYMKNEFIDHLPPAWKDKLDIVIEGNHTPMSDGELADLITKHVNKRKDKKKTEPITLEAKKILNKNNKT